MVKKENHDNEKHKGANHNKGGFTVGELQNKMNKYGFEISLCAILILTAIFTLIWGGMWAFWSIILCMAGAVVGILFPQQIKTAASKVLGFVYKEKFTSIVIAVLGIVISIFLPPVIFAIVGLVAGKSFALNSKATS